MINELVRIVFKVIFFILRWGFNILLLPLKPILLLFPKFTEFLEVALNFLDNYVIKAIAFGRAVFVNLTGFPQELITISASFALGILAVISTLKIITFVINMWRTFKGGSSN